MLGPQAILGQWWEFEDKNGHGYCQTDAMTRVNGVLCIFECKLSYVPGAWRQLECLYLPVVSEALGEIPRLVQVNRYLRGVPDARVAHSLQEAISASGGRTVLHWSGELRLAS
jgi:hypothetical protein